MAAAAPVAVEPRLIYLVERAPPAATSHSRPERNLFLEKIRRVVAPALVLLGMVVLVAAAVTLGGHLFGTMAIASDTVQMLFMAGIMSIISGYHLATGKRITTEVGLGPIAMSM
ncbi:MAG TPA: hypothetical protein VLF94_01515 [Chlamydiales bacterium]|nr:hypothetical protein [Chlamydiales bacterium]